VSDTTISRLSRQFVRSRHTYVTVSDTSVALQDVLAAREAIGGRLHHTPVLSSATLGERVFLKAELFQKTGSFKPRGVLTNLASLGREERARGVISVSAGNHAQAVAWGSAQEGLDALLVMWQGASEAKIAATRAYGAEVDLDSMDGTEAFQRMQALIEETGRTLVHPFDHELTIAGQGTLGLELVEDVRDVDVVVVPVGGGGLVSGTAVAVTALRPRARVVGVEPELAPTMTRALAAGRPVHAPTRSVADALAPPFAGELCVEICRGLLAEVVLLTEDEIRAGMRFLYARAKLACEPGGAAAAAALLAGKVRVERGETVVAVVSGGNVATQTTVAILAGE
jgi:threonine dehydratase